jgi:hypothetical protein
VILAASGGADWADTTTNTNYYLYGVDPRGTMNVSSPYFRRYLGQLATPAPGGTMSLRNYAQMTVRGSDVYANLTTLAIGNMTQLLYPVVYGGVWGEGLRWGLTGDPSDASVSTTSSLLAPSGGSFGGGVGAMLLADGTVVEMGSQGIFQRVLSAAEMSTSAANAQLRVGTTTARSFKLLSWFQLGD